MLETYNVMKEIELGINHGVFLSFCLEEDSLVIKVEYKNKLNDKWMGITQAISIHELINIKDDSIFIDYIIEKFNFMIKDSYKQEEKNDQIYS